MAPILLVDDEQEIRSVLARIIRRGGYDVLEAGDGAKALQIVRSTALSAVLLDLRMPTAPGDEVLQMLQQEAPSLPVIMVSGALDPETQARLIALGAKACVPKPVDHAELLSTLSSVIAGPEDDPRT